MLGSTLEPLLLQVLAKKMIAIMELSQQQLSKQDHYDYSLRSFVIPIARAAGGQHGQHCSHSTTGRLL